MTEPAFPQVFKIGKGENLPDGKVAEGPYQFVNQGMTLRDYFAGQALAGISAMSGDGFSLSPEQEAGWAYQRADAMIAARKENT